MNTIRKGWSIYAIISVVCVLSTVMFASMQEIEASISCAAICTTSLILFYRQNRLLYAARLICDNRILTVPSSIAKTENRLSKKTMEETVVSTFGLLLGNKVYQWGCDGICGIRLHEVWLDREHICLTFGVDGNKLHVELMHGMTDSQSILEITQKLWHETGVQAKVSGWYE